MRRFVSLTVTLAVLVGAALPAAAQVTAERPITARATIGSPRPLPGGGPAIGVGNAVTQRGELMDVISFQRWAGSSSKLTRPATFVIRNAEDWASIWSKTGERPPRPFPDGNMAIAIFIGPKDIPGYSVGIVSVRQEMEDLFITYIVNKPSHPTISSVQTSPWLIHVLPYAGGRIRFISTLSNE